MNESLHKTANRALATSPGTGSRAPAARSSWWRLRPLAQRAACGPIGLELGYETLNLVQLAATADGPALRAVLALPYPCQRAGVLGDAGVLRRLLREAFAAAPFSGRQVVSCLPAEDVRLTLIAYRQRAEEREADQILKLARERLEDDASAYLVDYLPVRTRGEGEGDRAALVAMARRERVVAYLELLRRAGLRVQALDVGPAAIARVVTGTGEPRADDNVLAINFARERTFLTLFSGRRLILDREVTFGEDALVELVAASLELKAEHARTLVYRCGVSLEPDGDGADKPPLPDARAIARTVAAILKPRLLGLRDEVQKAVLYAVSQTRGAGIRQVLLLGGVARWPGIEELLAALLALPVAPLDPFANIAREPRVPPLPVGAVCGLANATGCALRGITRDA